MKKSFFVAVCALSVFNMSATVIKGHFEKNADLIYNVSVIPSDSLKYTPISFSGYENEFKVNVGNIRGNVCVNVSSVGYNDYIKSFNNVDSASVLDLGYIQLERNHVLNEIVVKAPKLNVEHDGADYTISSLSGTIMGNAGNGIDMLRWTPGVVVDNNDGISVIGKGSSEIYINDKKVMSNSELRALSSSNVSKIEIIREPDAKYGSQTESVIKIYTKKPIKDYLAASLLDAVDIKQRVSNTTNLTVDGKSGNLSGNVSLSYTLGNTEGYNDSHTIITKENGIYEKFDTTNYSARVHNWNLFAGMNYALNSKSVLGLQYNGVFS